MITWVKKQLRRLPPKSAFAHSVSVLVRGTASAQVLLILAAPLLTRLYTPEDFGLLAVYASLLAIIGVISSLRYELAIPLPEDDGEAATVALLCLILVVISTLFSALLVLLMGPVFAKALAVPTLAEYVWLLPLGVLITGFYTVSFYWALRRKLFTTIAVTKFQQAVAIVAIQLVAFKLGAFALLIGQTAGQALGVRRLGFPAITSGLFRNIKSSRIIKLAIQYKKFPAYSSWGGLLNVAGTQLLPLLLAPLFGPSAAGFYFLANRTIFLPSSVLQKAFSNVLLSSSDIKKDKDKYAALICNTHRTLIKISCPASLFIFVFSPHFFELLFGGVWVEAGVYAQWLSVMLFFQFVSSPLTMVFHTLYRTELTLISNGLLFLLRTTGILIGFQMESALVAIILYSLLSSLGYLIFTLLSTSIAGINKLKLFHNYLVGAFLATITLGPSVALLAAYGYSIYLLIASLVILLIYYSYLYLNPSATHDHAH